MGLESPLDRRLVLGFGSQPVRDVDSPDDDHAVILLLHLAPDVAREVPLARLDPARLQRASEGTGQSAAGGGHDVVQRRGDLSFRLHAVVLRDGPVNPELDGSVVRRKPSAAIRTLDPLDPDVGRIDGVAQLRPRL